MAESEKAPKPTDTIIETIEKPKSRSLQGFRKDYEPIKD